MVDKAKEQAIIAESLRRVREDVEMQIRSGETSVSMIAPGFFGLAPDNLKEFIMPSAAHIITLMRVKEASKWN